MSSKITLTIIAGSKRGEMFPFDKHDTLLFGRMDDAHICLPDDQQVSRHHFILEVNPPDARVRDLGSLNGTYVNNVKYGGRQKHETEGKSQEGTGAHKSWRATATAFNAMRRRLSATAQIQRGPTR